MSGGINVGELPSWIMVLLIGFGVVYASSNGILPEFGELGRLMIFAALALGAFYFLSDILNKL